MRADLEDTAPITTEEIAEQADILVESKILLFHPAADKFDLMEGAEFAELVGDIQRRGLQFPITTFRGQIIDGRNRSRACEKAGIEPRYVEFEGKAEDIPRFVISANIHRRHLKPAERSELIKKVLALDPTRSDRAVAADLKVDKNVVSRARKQMESTGAAAPVEKRTGRDGKVRKQPVRKQPAEDVNETLVSSTAMPPEGKAAFELIARTNGGAGISGQVVAMGGAAHDRDTKLLAAVRDCARLLKEHRLFRERHRKTVDTATKAFASMSRALTKSISENSGASVPGTVAHPAGANGNGVMQEHDAVEAEEGKS